jgi:polysaccharide pyruvyl transferase WcaK-like protein
MTKIFTASWGQLERSGSNVGDEAIFASQVRDLSRMGDDVIIGVMSGDPQRTRRVYGAMPFDVGRGRLRSMARGVKWADIVIVGGGELAQDRSSLLYTPFNLHPIRLAKHYGKPAFAWSVGIGQEEELARWTPGQLRKWLGYCRGVTVRDGASYATLMDLGLDPDRVRHTSDSTFTLAGDFAPAHGTPDILGVAVRNVSNRQGKLLPLEIRRKLGLYREPDVTPTRRLWASVLDRHIERNGGEIRFFPFHTGSLSNSDDEECIAVMSMMKHSEYASVSMPTDIRSFLNGISECRVMISVPLHGSILSVVTGTVPIAVPYASKGFRFMEEAGLKALSVRSGEKDWSERLFKLLERTWESSREILRDMTPVRSSLAERCSMNLEHFRETCL